MTKPSANVVNIEKKSLVQQLGSKFKIESSDLETTLAATAFKLPGGKKVSPEQMRALLIIADQYGLNPFAREIYAFPDSFGGVVPVVGVDGWSRIINENPQFDGMEFRQDKDSCTCIIYRKDRSHPTTVTEYTAECSRSTAPWKSHPKRMMRHKSLIQCARLAFGLVGIFDPDEAERIVEQTEKDITKEVKVEMPKEMVEPSKERVEPSLADNLGAMGFVEVVDSTLPNKSASYIHSKDIPLLERIAACSTLAEVKSLKQEVAEIESPQDHQAAMIAGTAQVKKIKGES